MTYEEFCEKKGGLYAIITKAESDIKELEKSYVDEQVKDILGKKVRCYSKDWRTNEFIDRGIGYVSGGEVMYGGFEYKINKVKKDGTMSGQSAGLYGIIKVEVIDE